MARKVFFSFHFQRDAWRIWQVRNSWVVSGKGEAQPFFLDKAKWESIKREGNRAIKNWIDEQLKGTSVTIVLIGKETADRHWVKYEIEQSIQKRNGLIGIYIHNVENQEKKVDVKGDNPFEKHFGFIPCQGPLTYPCCSYYDWIVDNGYENIECWIEKAARQAGN